MQDTSANESHSFPLSPPLDHCLSTDCQYKTSAKRITFLSVLTASSFSLSLLFLSSSLYSRRRRSTLGRRHAAPVHIFHFVLLTPFTFPYASGTTSTRTPHHSFLSDSRDSNVFTAVFIKMRNHKFFESRVATSGPLALPWEMLRAGTCDEMNSYRSTSLSLLPLPQVWFQGRHAVTCRRRQSDVDKYGIELRELLRHHLPARAVFEMSAVITVQDIVNGWFT